MRTPLFQIELDVHNGTDYVDDFSFVAHGDHGLAERKLRGSNFEKLLCDVRLAGFVAQAASAGEVL
jgi:hypothetical protein